MINKYKNFSRTQKLTEFDKEINHTKKEWQGDQVI